MPKVRKTATKTEAKLDKITCIKCLKEKKSSNFYQSYNPLHETNKLPYCKDCIKEICYDSNGELDIELCKNMLKITEEKMSYTWKQIYKKYEKEKPRLTIY